jgi:hypothetical protein
MGCQLRCVKRTEHIVMQNLNDVIQVGDKSTDKTNGYVHNHYCLLVAIAESSAVECRLPYESGVARVQLHRNQMQTSYYTELKQRLKKNTP